MTDIARERRLLAAQGLVIRTREQAGFTFDYSGDRTVTSVAEDFMLHIAVVNDPGDLIGTEDQVARTVERIGINRFPATGMSYNALSFNTGRLYEGQPLTRRGAHTYNDKRTSPCSTHGARLTSPIGDQWNLNYSTRALCLPQMPDDPVTDAQIRSAAKWAAAQIRAGLAKPTARWHGHRDCAWKDCPGSRGYAAIPYLMNLTKYYTQVGLGSTTNTGGDVQLSDAIPGQTDPDGTPTTVGEALVRGNWAYNQIREGGQTELRIQVTEARANWAYNSVTEGGNTDRRLDTLEGRVTSTTDARAQYAYEAVTEGGAVDARLDALENAPKA